MKKGNKKRAYKLFAFSFFEFEIGANRFSIKFCINQSNSFVFKNVRVVPRKAAKFENPVKFFLKCLLWSIAAKLENVGTKMSLQIDKIFWNFILILWLVTLPCFLAKVAQIFEEVIVFFPERREEIEPWFWHIWIAQ